MRHVPTLLALSATAALAGCIDPDADLALDGEDDAFPSGKADDGTDTAGALRLANDLSTEDLTDVCRVHPLAAGNIVAHRTANGPIPDLAALDAIANVGPRVLTSLSQCWIEHYRDAGGGWRAKFGLPTGTVEMAVNLVIPAYQNAEWANLNRTVDEVLEDESVRLDPVVEHAQCLLRGTNPGRVWLECRRRKFRPTQYPGLQSQESDRRWFTATIEIASDGSFAGQRYDHDGRPSGERHLLWLTGRLEADREVTLASWKYLYATPYASDTLIPYLMDLAWGADEVTARFQPGGWDHFDEVAGETVAIPGGAVTVDCGAIPGSYLSYRESCVPGAVTQVPAFEMDRTEVTVAAYSACVQEGKCTDLCRPWEMIETCAINRRQSMFDTATTPVVGVGKWQAEEFCTWAGKQLPTTEQWHLAANADATAYPWGDAAPTCGRANSAGCGDQVSSTARPSGRSPAGVLDLAGNVSEHTRHAVSLEKYVNGTWQGVEYAMELRGGSFASDAAGLRSDRRELLMPRMTGRIDQLGNVGIRCVRDLP